MVRCTVIVKTGNKRFAGTAARVTLCVYGTKLDRYDYAEAVLTPSDARSFETNSVVRCAVDLKEFGHPIKIRIKQDNRGTAPGWYLESITINRSLPDGKTAEYYFEFMRWLANDEGDRSLIDERIPKRWTIMNGREPDKREVDEREENSRVDYEITVKTGDAFGAGTDANVFITLFGEDHDSGRRRLKYSSTSKNKFEKGSVDVFSIPAVYLGKIRKVVLEEDNTGILADWQVTSVSVRVPGRERHQSIFPGPKWLRPSTGLTVEFFPE